MKITNAKKKKFLKEYKNILLYAPYDEYLIESYENSKTHFIKKGERVIIGKRKKYDKIVNEFINEILKNFEYYVDTVSEESLCKIEQVINGTFNDFSSFEYDKIRELADKLSEESWIGDNLFIINS